MIPIRIHPIDAPSELVGFGKKIMSKLEQDMSFRSLKVGTSAIRMADGSIIKCTVTHNLRKIDITYPEYAEGDEDDDRKCSCGRYFSEGKIKGITNVAGYEKPAQILTVEVCQQSGSVVINTGVCRDYSEFNIGEMVWVCLDIREVLPMPPANGRMDYTPDILEYSWNMPWGSSGREKSYTIKKQGSNEYMLPCNYPLSTPDDEWPPLPLSMCNIPAIEDDCFWFFNDYATKTYKSPNFISSEKQLHNIAKIPLDPDRNYAVNHLYNFQVIKMGPDIDNGIFDYELKIGYVSFVDHETNTATVKIIDRFDHLADSSTYPKYSTDLSVSETLTEVSIRMTTDRFYYATEAEREGMFKNEKAWSTMLYGASREINTFVYVMVWNGDPNSDKRNHIIAAQTLSYYGESYLPDRVSSSRVLTNRIFPTLSFHPFAVYSETISGISSIKSFVFNPGATEIPEEDVPKFTFQYSQYSFFEYNSKFSDGHYDPSESYIMQEEGDTWVSDGSGGFIGKVRPQNTWRIGTGWYRVDGPTHYMAGETSYPCYKSLEITVEGQVAYSYISSGYEYYVENESYSTGGSTFTGFIDYSYHVQSDTFCNAADSIAGSSFFMLGRTSSMYWNDSENILHHHEDSVYISSTDSSQPSRDEEVEAFMTSLSERRILSINGDGVDNATVRIYSRQYGQLSSMFAEKPLKGYL